MTRTVSNAQLSLLDEIFVDNFAGGGGASVGIELATGHPMTIAVNHDPDAIAMHKANHPYTKHYCESVWDIDPRTVCAGHKVALAWFSPDCKHFSKAKGGTPVKKKIRGLAWVVLRWAALVRPRVIMLENVEEFQTWGPVRRGRPIKSKRGQTFAQWKSQLEALGYQIEHRELRACDYGVPTIRKRFYLVARCDGQPIVWPTPTHGDPKSAEVKAGKLLPWHTAAECIDFTLPCPSIFGRKTPLKPNTMQRVARGLDKFVVKNPQPFIVQCKFNNQPESVMEPLRTITSVNAHMLTTPVMTAIGQTGFAADRSYSVNDPVRTIVTKAEQCLMAPVMTPIGYGERKGEYTRATDIDKPLSTIVAANKHFVSMPFISKYFGGVVGTDTTSPLPTVTATDHNALAAAHLLEYYGNAQDGLSLDDPLHTITAKDREAVVTSHLCVLRNNMDGKAIEEPLPTITAGGGHLAEVRTVITKIDQSVNLQRWPEVRQLLNQYCGYQLADDEVLLFFFGGCLWYISDIGLRMLEPRELATAQGFCRDYILCFPYKKKMYSKAAQTARIGNSVSPMMAAALVRCNLPEYCTERLTTVAELNERIAV